MNDFREAEYGAPAPTTTDGGSPAGEHGGGHLG